MSNIIDFKSKADLEAAEQLDAFIVWAQATLPKGVPDRVHASIRWDMDSWHESGIESATFTALGSPRRATAETRLVMQSPFMDFAKAVVVNRCVFHRKKSIGGWLGALKALEMALVELTGARDVTQVSAAVCNRACGLMQLQWPLSQTAYLRSKTLERIIKLMGSKRLLATSFRWSSPLIYQGRGTLKQQKLDREKKLPSRESILALGELFNNKLTDPLDIVITSACGLLLSQPGRIGELADVECAPIVFKEHKGVGQRMFLRWYAEKGFGAVLKPVMTGMEPVVERLIERMLPITEEARTYAAWLEDHPDEFPPHEGVPDKSLDDPLTYSEVCSALKIHVVGKNSPRSKFKVSFLIPMAELKSLGPAARAILDEIQDGWDTSKGKPIYLEGKPGLQRIEFDDKFVITLRKLNILMREKYLPKDFPYTTRPEDGKQRVKYRDALFTVRTGALVAESAVAKLANFGVEIAAKQGRMSAQLGGSSKQPSIFERHGYKGVRVNSHAFRHELNTEMQRAGLSQLLIDAFSGRTSMGSVYNHETVEERTQAVAAVHPKTKQINAKRLEKVRTNAPLSLSDVTDLAESDQDRVIHQSHVGVCVHNFASEPCPKMGSCLRCGKLACVKGDDEKLKNLKEERDYLQKRYSDAIAAESRGEIGATEWVKKVSKDLFKCDALIKLLEDPELENGDIVWNVDNGWNITNNAAAMVGLIEPQVIEIKDQEALPALDELSAMLDEIEV
ncbi:hypothetical protein [Hahella ganghwensis]|uniref:hypothetical protein n=1 Tax=Hahella ganghwensis TaxID=286420 RepID=UPI0003808FB9|nr:hypothetical protein [Hahella ganghwensis]